MWLFKKNSVRSLMFKKAEYDNMQVKIDELVRCREEYCPYIAVITKEGRYDMHASKYRNKAMRQAISNQIWKLNEEQAELKL